MTSAPSFIETQFPVSRLSKESYKERKAVAGQTLPGLGRWWGRKPLVLVRAAIIGMLLPATSDPATDRDIFLRLMTMDDEGLLLRRNKNFTLSQLFALLTPSERTQVFDPDAKSVAFRKELSVRERKGWHNRAFLRLNYDRRLEMCARPEEIAGPSASAWQIINAHCGTTAYDLANWVQQMGSKRFGHTPRVGDGFCGGGSIPFEAARIGCDTFGSDLSPVAALLTWEGLNVVLGEDYVHQKVSQSLDALYEVVQAQIDAWGIEKNGLGQTATNYLYCHEVLDPNTGWLVPVSPTWVIATNPNVVARLNPNPNNKSFDITIHSNVSDKEIAQAQAEATWNKGLACPVDNDGNWIPISHRRSIDIQWLRGKTGLRLWDINDLVPCADDVFQERLYCVIYKDISGKNRSYIAPTTDDIEREEEVEKILRSNFREWQEKGYIPSNKIEGGYNQDQPIRERGFTHWHHLFNPRQLLLNGLFMKAVDMLDLRGAEGVTGLLMAGRIAEVNSRLCRWKVSQGSGIGGSIGTFDNQALNTLMNYAARSMLTLQSIRLSYPVYPNSQTQNNKKSIALSDARDVRSNCDIWITDPAYADAINYEELSEFFLAWYERRLKRLFPDWYVDSKRALAVRGSDEAFRLAMVECYRNFTVHMPDDGMQIVMFTHTNAEVWSDLALILWAAGLRVSQAWTIATETAASGLKSGNYVQGTVLLVLRKQTENLWGDLADVFPEVQREVERQMDTLLALDERSDRDFDDSDYQLAAYAAALRVLTRYKTIQDINVERELRRVRKKGETSPLTELIETAVKIASNYLVPTGIARPVWRELKPDERLYVKGLEIEAHGDYRSGVYMEFARGYGVKDYHPLLSATKANQTRLKTPTEFRSSGMSGPGFAESLLRHVLYAVYKTGEEDDPNIGRRYLRQELPDYWGRREHIVHLLHYIAQTPTPVMEHWADDKLAAELLAGMVANDSL